ncbi:MAG: hypothetical protein AVDCRST_MAG73-2025, partial [uncultured Thermomicrobiales bacterium]
ARCGDPSIPSGPGRVLPPLADHRAGGVRLRAARRFPAGQRSRPAGPVRARCPDRLLGVRRRAPGTLRAAGSRRGPGLQAGPQACDSRRGLGVGAGPLWREV